MVSEFQVLGQVRFWVLDDNNRFWVLQRVKKKKISLEFSWVLKKSYLTRWNSLRVLRRRWSMITMFVAFNPLGSIEPFVRFGPLGPIEPLAF